MISVYLILAFCILQIDAGSSDIYIKSTSNDTSDDVQLIEENDMDIFNSSTTTTSSTTEIPFVFNDTDSYLKNTNRLSWDNTIMDKNKIRLRRNPRLPMQRQEGGGNGMEYHNLARGGSICNLCVVVDEQFVRAYKLTDSAHIITKIRQLVDKVSWVFRTVDWNNDGIPDNIGFNVISLVRGWTPDGTQTRDWNYDTPRPAMELLGLFARLNFKACCLGVGFTNRPFEHNQVGVSFIASATLLGGICDIRAPVAPMNSANVALISSRGLKGTLMSFNDLSAILLHELGHTFGVQKHDMDLEIAECSGYEHSLPNNYNSDKVDPPKGRFIMWGQDIQGLKSHKENNLKFSPCSRQVVNNILYSDQARANCFVASDDSFCGNGIVEPPEECDCGNEIVCRILGASCCGSRISTSPCKIPKNLDEYGFNQDRCRMKKDLLAPNVNPNENGQSSRFSPSGTFLQSLMLVIVVLAC